MSSVYVLEPPTKGKVILNTTYGPIDIELWPKEAPKAVRNFVQLCLEGYYDNTIFHRVIPGFLVQGGDPTSTGNGGESIYGGAFADEFHSRLRFNHRGLLACANAGTPHSNGSQFFFSLDRCEWLDRKNTIFGKVTGDSVYNLVSLGEVETGKEDRPIDPAPRITSVEVLWNPFEDIIPRVVARVPDHPAADLINKESTKKPVKKLNLLSFGEEAEEEEKELASVKQKIKSSHDVLSDPRLLKEEMPSKELNPAETKAIRDMQLSVREALSSKKEVSRKDAQTEDDGDDDDGSFDTRMRQQVLRKKMEAGDLPSKQKPKKNGSSNSKAQQVSTSRSESVTKSIDDDQPKVEKLSLKKKGIGSDVRADRMAKADTDMQLMGDAERRRLLQKQKKRRLQGREDDVLERIEKFKKAFSTDATGSGASAGEDVSDWKKTRLQFAPEAGKDGMTRKEDPNDYVVHDPLLEKGKEKFNLMQAKQKKRGREWAGKSLT